MRRIYFLSLFLLASCSFLLASCGLAYQRAANLPPALNLQPVAHFDSSLRETSGLIRWQRHFISHNDSGNAPDLFILDKAGKLLGRVPVAAENHDWEDITAHGTQLYIADIGNNSGRRRDLNILVIPFSTAALKQPPLSLASKLPVAYAEQSHVQPTPYQHNFDAEALTWVNGELWLFTKRWRDQKTDIYKVPTAAPSEASNQAASPLHAQQRLDPQMLVTGADFDARTHTLMLLGYSRSWFYRRAWIWLYPVQDGKVIEHLGRKYPLNKSGQFEGISLGHDGFIYVTREGWRTNMFHTELTLSQLLTD